MTQTMNPRSAIVELSRSLKEPEVLARARVEALDAYLGSPSPDRVTHLWRYTDPKELLLSEDSIQAASAASVTVAPGIPRGFQELLSRQELSGAVFLDGAGPPRMLRAPEGHGVILEDLREADAGREHLGRLVGCRVDSRGHGKLEALNLALWSQGVYLRVPRNVQVHKPIHVWLRVPEAPYLATRLIVVLEEGAELTLIDECEGGGEGGKLNSVVEIFAGQGSRLRYVSVQRLGFSMSYHVTQRISVGRDSNVLTALASLGSGVTKADLGSYLEGPGANVELVGFLCGEGKQHFDHHTIHDHRAAHTYSDLDFKVVLKDKARSAYTGLIRIEPDAPQSEAYQENRNLLLSEGAKAESIPELEILTDDVKCTHGATMGNLDPEHLFYLMSRGLPRGEALRLIVGGFIEPTLSRLPEDLRARLRDHVEDRIKEL